MILRKKNHNFTKEHKPAGPSVRYGPNVYMSFRRNGFFTRLTHGHALAEGNI